VQAATKWKRVALQRFGMQPGEGLCTDMRAVRKDYFLDHDHSAYVDQWDWERAITADQRNLDFLKEIVGKIWKVLVSTERYLQDLFPQLKTKYLNLPEKLTFLHAEDLLDMYPDILGDIRRPLAGSRVYTVPVIASFVMVAWDLSMDPVWSTIMHGWIWLQGGAYFGVPVSNFLGWYLTVYVIYQLFALYLRERPTYCHSFPSGYWQMAILFYGISAAGNLVLTPRAGLSVVSDPTGAQWKVSSIVAASALVSIFVMGTLALFAWLRLATPPVETGEPPTESQQLASQSMG